MITLEVRATLRTLLGNGVVQVTESYSRARGFGVFEADLRTAELRKHGVRIKLQEQPFLILSLLLEHPGEVVTREELRRRLWPAHTFVDFDRSLNKAMTKLRAALGDSADNPRYVETIPRHGYRFIAPVQVPHEEPPAAIPAGSVIEEERKSAESSLVREHKTGATQWLNLLARGRKRIYGIAAVVGVGALALVVYGRLHSASALGTPANAVSLRRSVAVLGFRNLSGDPRDAWLSTAFSDWLTTELTAGEQVRAIPGESVARMRMEMALPEVDGLGPESLVRIRKNLGTDYVVAGSYAMLNGKPDGQIRLDLSLQDTRSGETVGAFSQTGTETHLLDLVSRAGELLRGKLGVPAVTREEAAEVAIALPTKSETARLYSEGLTRLRTFEALRGKDLLLRAIEVEPNYALSHAALATAWEQLGYEENAKSEAKKAFDRSADLSRAERLLVEGRYYETSGNWDKAAGIYRALFEFFPDNLDYGLALARAEYRANQWKDTLATVEALRQLPAPLRDDPRIDLQEQDAARSLGDTKRSEAALKRAAEKSQAAGASLLLAKAYLDRAWLYENLGRFSEVESFVRDARALYMTANDRAGVAEATTIGAIALKNQGDYLGAKKGYEEILNLYRQIGNRTGVAAEDDNLGDILVYLGDLEGARHSYEAGLAIYREVGDQNAEALVMNGLGDVFLEEGNNQKALEMYDGSLEICRRIGNRGREASALAGIGRLHRREGDLAQALRQETEARSKFEQIGDRAEVARVDLYLGELLLDGGKNAEAAAAARRATEAFGTNMSESEEVAAILLYAQAQVAAGQLADAGKNVEKAVKAASETRNREMQMLAGVVGARIRAASNNSKDVRQAVAILSQIITDSGAANFADVAYEARLWQGEIELKSAEKGPGRDHLAALQKDATSRGFGLVARKAGDALRAAAHGTTLISSN